MAWRRFRWPVEGDWHPNLGMAYSVILTAFLHGLGVLMYILLWIFVPLERRALMAPVAAVAAATPPPVPPSDKTD